MKMNKDVLEGKWKTAKGKLKQKWAKLTDQDIEQVQGHTDELRGRLQERYGYSKDQADKEINEFSRTLN
jgi:uncharacterized protein YjbJ (UPF0337 family)